MSSVSFYCPICLEYVTATDFRIFRCGHGCCTSCLGNFFENERRRPCYNCRAPVARGDAHLIFLDIAETKVQVVASVVEGLKRMDASSKLISVKKAGEKIRVAAEKLAVREDIANQLLQAVEDFKQRIIPMFTKAKLQLEEIASLRKDLCNSQHERDSFASECAKMGPLEKTIEEAKNLLLQTRIERDQALQLAEEAKNETLELRQVSAAWKDAITKLKEENERYRGQLQGHTDLDRSRTAKIDRMKKRLLELEEHAARGPIHLLKDPEMRSSTNSIPSSPTSCSTQIHMGITDTYSGFEGMPRPGFESDWQIHSKKRKSLVTDSQGIVKSGNFPIMLGRNGRIAKPAQLGPKKSVRVSSGLK